MKNAVFWDVTCVVLVRTDVSEELSASFISVTRICELGTTLVVTGNLRTLRRNKILVILMMEALSSYETRFLQEPYGVNIPEDAILYSHRRESLKSYIHSTSQYVI
jgi:hypothetical protein